MKSLEWTRSLKCLPVAEVCDSSILIAKLNTKIQQLYTLGWSKVRLGFPVISYEVKELLGQPNISINLCNKQTPNVLIAEVHYMLR